jgi:prepilin-type N-terminal cleavage/methylation domain-containing protein
MRGIPRRNPPQTRVLTQREPRRHGFSLAELLIVVLVLSIVAMTAVPLIGNGLRDARLSQATADVVAALNYARSRALASGSDLRVSFPSGGARVLVECCGVATDVLTCVEGEQIEASLVEDAGFVPVPHPFEKHTNAFVMVYQGRGDPMIARADFGGTNVVQFSALGVPSSTGQVVIVCGDDHRTVHVAGSGGRIVVGD